MVGCVFVEGGVDGIEAGDEGLLVGPEPEVAHLLQNTLQLRLQR